MTLPPLAALREQAKKMKSDWHGEFSLTECQTVVARDHGFDNWPHMMCNHPEVGNNRTTFFKNQKSKREQVTILTKGSPT